MQNLPPYLKPGDTIGITCPAGYVSKDRIAYAVKLFKEKGFHVVVGNTVGSEYFYFSGNDEARKADLQAMLDDENIQAIMMGRGGYGMSRIIDKLDFTTFLKHPKWICGFSDITVIHNHIQSNFDLPCLHSPMCGAFTESSKNSPHILQFFDTITGKDFSLSFPISSFNRSGKASGIMTGGNLAMLAHLTGSSSEVDTTGKIVFIEDIGEHYYHVDRLLLNLKRAGKLENLAALLVGSFTEMEDTDRPFGQTVEEIVWDKIKDYDYPVAFNFPCGHQEVNYTLQLGRRYLLEVKKDSSFIQMDSFSAV